MGIAINHVLDLLSHHYWLHLFKLPSANMWARTTAFSPVGYQLHGHQLITQVISAKLGDIRAAVHTLTSQDSLAYSLRNELIEKHSPASSSINTHALSQSKCAQQRKSSHTDRAVNVQINTHYYK